jgi:signal transduction histidine kinase
VTQVLINLLSNAIKFSPENSKISIVIKRETLNENDRLLCSIIDHGAGVAVEEIGNLFQRFSQIKPSDNLTFIKGSGLGLFISRSIIEQHGGEIGYTPNPDGGSIFWFSLPIVGADS